MSEWGKVESRYGREVSGLKRLVKIYDYSQKRATETDKSFRELLISNIRQIKTTIVDLTSLAYKEKDQSANSMKRVSDDIDLAITEIKTLNYWKFPDSQQALEKIVKADMVLLNNMDLMRKSLTGIHTQILAAQTTNTTQINIKLENLRRLLSDFRAVFLERAEIIKIKR